MQTRRNLVGGLLLASLVLPDTTEARRPIRRAFFDVYPQATGTRLDTLPSNADHCGVSHFDFDGGDARKARSVHRSRSSWDCPRGLRSTSC